RAITPRCSRSPSGSSPAVRAQTTSTAARSATCARTRSASPPTATSSGRCAFALSPTSGLLEPALLALTPDRAFNQTATLASYINANQAAIIAEQHTVPALFAGRPFQAGAVFNDLTTWFAPGVDPEARHHFAINTCNGCHSTRETNTEFLQITPRFGSNEARL